MADAVIVSPVDNRLSFHISRLTKICKWAAGTEPEVDAIPLELAANKADSVACAPR
jgi:hypothetical protein